METSRSLTSQNLKGSILSPEDSLARMSATPASELGLTVHVPAYGHQWPKRFTTYDPNTRSWRTSQVCLTGELSEFSGTWPDSGSMRSGQCFQLAPLVHHTHGSACSFWPTPRASARDNCGGSNARRKAYRNGTYIGRNANPNVSEWLMGFPMGWTALPPSETP